LELRASSEELALCALDEFFCGDGADWLAVDGTTGCASVALETGEASL
jgi:hypothetical protein